MTDRHSTPKSSFNLLQFYFCKYLRYIHMNLGTTFLFHASLHQVGFTYGGVSCLQFNLKLKSTEQDGFWGYILVPRQWLINPVLRSPILRILPSYSLSKFAVVGKFYQYFMASQANLELLS